MVYYANLGRNIDSAGNAPTISTALESVRAYQWEVEFGADIIATGTQQDVMTLAAKQVNGLGMQVEDIEVNRVNDKVYYAGKPSMEELRVTFDNITEAEMSEHLFTIFTGATYDPETGKMADFNMDTFSKQKITLRQLKPDMSLLNEIIVVGAYPKKWTPSEYNYATNDFHTVEVTFRYDFILHN
tara:strand:+ start:414 stop:968 length:555 start_codon:yes stop_codon:yes gene_type:complete